MILCDHEYHITYIDTKAPGACHDARVLKNTELYKQFVENSYRPFPNSMIAGDSGYPDHFRWLCTPFPHSRDTSLELEKRIRVFQKYFLKIRARIECTIGNIE